MIWVDFQRLLVGLKLMLFLTLYCFFNTLIKIPKNSIHLYLANGRSWNRSGNIILTYFEEFGNTRSDMKVNRRISLTTKLIGMKFRYKSQLRRCQPTSTCCDMENFYFLPIINFFLLPFDNKLLFTSFR